MVRSIQLLGVGCWGLLAWAVLALTALAEERPPKTPSAAPDALQVHMDVAGSPAAPAAMDEPERRSSVPTVGESTPPARHLAPITSGHADGEGATDFMSMLFVFLLATIIGVGVIGRVSRLLHTPLMSLTNAISAISVVGAIILAGSPHYPTAIQAMGAVALFASMTNIVSGFLITDRMLKMFKTREAGKA